MRRWLTHLTIASYLGVLALGIGAHTISYGTGASPLMYYVIWDMFCGWSAHEYRYHVFAEGVSGEYYDITHGAWGDVNHFGEPSRINFDALGNGIPRVAMNNLRHTDHEPIHRIYVVEEAWPKSYNLDRSRWLNPDEPEKTSYSLVRMTLDADGQVVASAPPFLTHLNNVAVSDNPRLKSDFRRGQPFYAVSPTFRTASTDSPASPVMQSGHFGPDFGE